MSNTKNRIFQESPEKPDCYVNIIYHKHTRAVTIIAMGTVLNKGMHTDGTACYWSNVRLNKLTARKLARFILVHTE